MTRFHVGVVRSLALSAVSCLVFGGSAFACPWKQVGTLPRQASPVAFAKSAPHNGQDTFVGVWQVTYSVGGNTWDMSFDSWHADGTENDNDITPPLMSAMCEGVWELTAPRTAALRHVGWTWDQTGFNLIGPFQLLETNTLSADGNSYSGNFTLQQYDLDWNPVGQPTSGTISAARITVH